MTNPFRVERVFLIRFPQGSRWRSNPGLRLANAFGVTLGLRLANAFGVTLGLRLANAFGVRLGQIPAALLPEGVAAEKIFADVGDGVVEGFAGVAWLEVEFAGGCGAVQIPEILRHLDRARLDRRTHVPLLE